MITYDKLWKLLSEKNMKKTDLRQVITNNTVAKLGKNESVTTDTIDKICDFLDCQPGDIMEHISSKQLEKVADEFNRIQNIMIDNLKEQGVSEKEFNNIMSQMIGRMFAGENVIQTEIEKIKDKQKENLEADPDKE